MNGTDRTVRDVFQVLRETSDTIRAGFVGRRYTSRGKNPSGETQVAADTYADELLVERVADLNTVGSVASEERKGIVDTGSGVSVTIDPLDGSSNIASNNLVGTIVGIYNAPLPAKGTDLCGAAFLLYGPVTSLIVATKTGCFKETLSNGETVIRHEVSIPEIPKVYGMGGPPEEFSPQLQHFIYNLETKLKLRYGGSMVGDVNQVLQYGGIFGYPALESASSGKLRLQFECNPMAYIINRAGGCSSDGNQSILEVEPRQLHQRSPVYLGNQVLIDRLKKELSS